MIPVGVETVSLLLTVALLTLTVMPGIQDQPDEVANEWIH